MRVNKTACNLVLALLLSGNVAAQSTATKLVNNGPDSARIVLVVLGDGYAGTTVDQDKFTKDAERVVRNLMAFDVYKQHAGAFNVYRIDLVSKDSGITDAASKKDTALQTSYIGGPCYFAESNDTLKLLNSAMKAARLPETSKILILLNDQRFGGCARENKRFYITRNVGLYTIAHEYGHVLAALYDEYTDAAHSQVYSESLNERNCSNTLSAQKLAWSKFLAPNTPLPTVNSTATLGMFEGCNNYSKGLYKPTMSCLMLDTQYHSFCQVCRDLLEKELVTHQGPALPVSTLFQLPAREAQPPVRSAQPPTRGTQPAGRGGQTAQLVRYVDLFVRVFQNGTLQVIDASEETGTPPTSAPGTSDWFYEVESAGVPVAVSGLPAAAFEQRGYGAGDTALHTTTAASATMHLRVPATTLNQLADRQLQLNVYRANQPIVANQNVEILRPAQVAPGMLQGLVQQRAVVRVPAAPVGALGTAIRTYENAR